MKKLLLFAAVAGLGLVSASPPPKGPDNGPREAGRHYPPCSRAVTDRCIQLYERGRHDRREVAREDGARDDHRGHRMEVATVVLDDRHGRGEGGDHRWCREHGAHHGGHGDRMMVERVRVEPRPVVMTARVTRVVGCNCPQPRHHVAAPPRRQLAQRVRRAGERG